MPYTVFPLHGIRADGTCACRDGAACKSNPGKHPAISWSELEPGEQKFGIAGHGIATGAKSGVFVVDTDTDEADARFRSRCEVEGYDPDATHVVKTPKGKATRHYYFVWPGFPVRTSVGELLATDADLDEKTGKRNSKIDIRGDGGMVVMAGSPHANGGTYAAENANPPRVAPSFLLSWEGLRGVTRDPTANAPIPVSDIPIAAGPDVGRSVLEVRREMGQRACREMPPAVEGDGGSLAFWNVCVHLVRDLELPLDEVWELVTGIYNPRCEPPWSPKEIEHKIIDARDKSDKPPGMVAGLDVSALHAALKPEPVVTADGHVYECGLDSVTALKPSKTTARNVCNILSSHPSWEGVFAFDSFRGRVVCRKRPPIAMPGLENGNLDENDTFAVRVWFETIGGYVVSKDVAWDAVNAVARASSFHPLRDYLDALETHDDDAIDGLCNAFGLVDPHERMCMMRFLVGAVRRAYSPGCKLDNMLVLYGPPGLKKSTSVLALFGEEWVSQNLANIADEKKTGEVMAGKWAVEIAELKDIMVAGNETVAAFITRTSERFRAAYARGDAIDRLRTAVLIASTNEGDILRNSTGADARRFWIVKPEPVGGKIDVAWITANRDRVWSEARDLARAGERHWLEGEEEREHLERMKEHEDVDVWHDTIEDFATGREMFRAEDVYKHLGYEVEKLDRRVKMRVADTLRRLGCERRIIGKKRRRLWLVPEHLRTGEPSPEEAARRASSDVAAKLARN